MLVWASNCPRLSRKHTTVTEFAPHLHWRTMGQHNPPERYQSAVRDTPRLLREGRAPVLRCRWPCCASNIKADCATQIDAYTASVARR